MYKCFRAELVNVGGWPELWPHINYSERNCDVILNETFWRTLGTRLMKLDGVRVWDILVSVPHASKTLAGQVFCLLWSCLPVQKTFVANPANIPPYRQTCEAQLINNVVPSTNELIIDQFSKRIDLSTRLWGIPREFTGFIPQSLVFQFLILSTKHMYRKKRFCLQGDLVHPCSFIHHHIFGVFLSFRLFLSGFLLY